MENIHALTPAETEKPDKIDDGYKLPSGGFDPRLAKFFGAHEKRDQRRLAREAAIRSSAAEFVAPCAHHGDTSLFDTATGACLLCLVDNAGLPPAARYKASLGVAYVLECPVHGESVHRFGSAGCSECRDARGRPLRDRTARVSARRNGEGLYLDDCSVHGETQFHVVSGKCADCFTTSGRKRRAPMYVKGRPFDEGNPRAEARRAGLRSYAAQCDVHGRAEFSVAHGKCLHCYSASGAVRVRKAR